VQNVTPLLGWVSDIISLPEHCWSTRKGGEGPIKTRGRRPLAGATLQGGQGFEDGEDRSHGLSEHLLLKP
jgi:hypothetical protein